MRGSTVDPKSHTAIGREECISQLDGQTLLDSIHDNEHTLLALQVTASARRGSNLNGFNDFRIENGSRQGQNRAVSVLYVPSSLDRRTQASHPILSVICRF